MITSPSALIIEDDESLATIFAEALNTVDFKTEIIRDGGLAMTRLATTEPDVVILDLHLPNVSGKDILHHIQTDQRLRATRVMIVTADAALVDSLQDEADLALLKPVSFHQLRDLAARLRPPDTLDLK